MAIEFRQYPAAPPGEPGTPDPRTDHGFFQVALGDEVVAAYDAVHYPSIESVLGDVLTRIASGELPGTGGGGYTLWRAGRRTGFLRARSWGPGEAPPTAGREGPGPLPGPPSGEGEGPGRIRIAESIRDDYRAA